MQVSWIDAEEIAKLTAQIVGPLGPDEQPSCELNAMPDFMGAPKPEGAASLAAIENLAQALEASIPEEIESIGTPSSTELAHLREKLHSIRERAQDAGLLPQRELPPTARHPIVIPPPPLPARPAPFLPLEGTLGERLQSFLNWARKLTPADDIFLVDDHGELLWGESSHDAVALSSLLAANANIPSGTNATAVAPAVMHSRLDDKNELAVIPCNTRYGAVTLALINARQTTPDTAACLREALTLCIDGAVAPQAG